jgi:hypothetical protein
MGRITATKSSKCYETKPVSGGNTLKYKEYDEKLLYSIIERHKEPLRGSLLWSRVADEYRAKRGDVNARPPDVIDRYFLTHMCKIMGTNVRKDMKDPFTIRCKSLLNRIAKYHRAVNVGHSEDIDEDSNEDKSDMEDS